MVEYKTYLVFIPGSWHRAAKALGISRGKGRVLLVIHKEALLIRPEFMLIRGLKARPATRKTRCLKGWNF